MLLRSDADPDCGNNAGRTPLHSAVCNKQLSMVRLIVLEGCGDPQARDLDAGGVLALDPRLHACIVIATQRGIASNRCMHEKQSPAMHL